MATGGVLADERSPAAVLEVEDLVLAALHLDRDVVTGHRGEPGVALAFEVGHLHHLTLARRSCAGARAAGSGSGGSASSRAGRPPGACPPGTRPPRCRGTSAVGFPGRTCATSPRWRGSRTGSGRRAALGRRARLRSCRGTRGRG